MMKRLTACCLLLLAGVAAHADPRDEESIAALFTEQFTTSWQAGDAEALARLWLVDGDWMSVVGSRRVFTGPEQIAQVWEVGLQGRDSEPSLSLRIDIDAIRRFGPDLAQVDLVMTFGQPSTGVLREAMVAIVEWHDDAWKIASSRVARISYEPPSQESGS